MGGSGVIVDYYGRENLISEISQVNGAGRKSIDISGQGGLLSEISQFSAVGHEEFIDHYGRGGLLSEISQTSGLGTKSGGGVGGDTNGGVFITDAAPTGAGNVGDKVFEDTIVLDSLSSDTDLLTISVMAWTGYRHYIPVITVNNVAVTNLAKNSYGEWEGSVDIDLSGGSTIIAVHEDGPTHSATVSAVAAPVITDLKFTDGYPGSQTELKENDTFDVYFTTDVDINRVEVQNFEAAKSLATDLTLGSNHTILVSIANRGSGTISLQTVKLRVRDANNFWSDYASATDFYSGDGVGTVELNNDTPVISSIGQGNIDYPATQAALKGVEQATVNHTVNFPSGVGTVLYESPNSDLTISNTTTYETAKTVTRLAGSYNISTTNFRLTATKTTNAKTSVRNVVVYIANTACTLTVSEPAARLRSGGNAGTAAQNHTISIIANQQLGSAPTLVAPVGTWQGGGFAGGPTTWTRALQIHDNDVKATNTWGAISGTNLAGIATSAITGEGNYVTGGFVVRTITIAAWPNREGSIGTQVSNTAKLLCQNNSKGVGYYITYRATVGDEVDKYTITEPTGVANASGNLWYNCDLSNAISNGSGTATITIEETV